MQLNPTDQPVEIKVDANDASHVTISPTDASAGATWISRVDSLNGNGYCEFNRDSKPIIRMEQKR